MRDPFGLNERLFAMYYPVLIGLSERAGQAERRHELIAGASGRTLEIGAGGGHNLAHYPAAVTELVVTEPSPHMIRHLRAELAAHPPDGRLVGAAQDRRGTPALRRRQLRHRGRDVRALLDPRPAGALVEIARVLRPGGRYLFIEHVRSTSNRVLGGFQDLVEIPHRYLAAGCHPNRRTEQLLAESPLPSRSSSTSRCHARPPPSVRPSAASPAADRTQA